MLVLNLAIGFATELRAHRAMEALLRLEVPRARVVREGRSHEVDARELVPGDIILLEAGQTVPADARLLQSTELRTVEASLSLAALVAPLSRVLRVTALSMTEWLVVGALGLLPAVAGQAIKTVRALRPA